MSSRNVMVDGNEAAARVAYLTSEVVAIYPITPASPMGEHADAWAAAERPNVWGAVPRVIEMQSEAGAAGAVHGSLQAGAMTTTFTASQGLLLMMPNMFKIAGELTPAVFHIAARSVATHALSIFCDHSDIMAVRSTGWAILAAASVQQSQDMAMISQMATLRSRIPFLHFFDGFRTSHEVNKIELLSEDDIRSLIDPADLRAHRARSLNPDRPVVRGTAQNPDVFFQARETVNAYYDAVPGCVQAAMDAFADRTGRAYNLFDYYGAPDAERVLVVMGSAAGAAREAVDALTALGERVGLLVVRLYRPFAAEIFCRTLPRTVRSLVVLDRTKEPGAVGEPLYQDVVTALTEHWLPGPRAGSEGLPHTIGGRYGLSSKEFTPAMAAACLTELAKDQPKRHFTVGIVDDLTHTSLTWDPSFVTEPDDVTRAVFWGLGADGTVGANKNSVKILGENTPLHVQGYFVYDSRKSGAVTVSHLRIGPRPIESTYLIQKANFVACHQFNFLERKDVLSMAQPGATFLLNSPYGPDEVWDLLPREIQRQVIALGLQLWVVDAAEVATRAGLGRRINTVMQTCFFELAGLLPSDEAVGHIKDAIKKTYKKLGASVVERNFAAVDGAARGLHRVRIPAEVTSALGRSIGIISDESVPDFVGRVTSPIVAGLGDSLPVSAMPHDGTFPTATSQFEKRSIADEIPIWDPAICTDCGLCPLVCPHAAIRMKTYSPEEAAAAPNGFKSKVWKGKEHPTGTLMTIQVAPDDCTGCGVCVDMCPARSKEVAKHKAIDMEPKLPRLEEERDAFDFFLTLPEADRRLVDHGKVKGCQQLQPLFEFSGACAGCGETPYLKLVTQLFGDRMVVANATGCSSIYGGNLPTTPWAKDDAGRGPAWSNSLFEDNAEFGLGMRLAIDQQRQLARQRLLELRGELGHELVEAIITAPQANDGDYQAVRGLVEKVNVQLDAMDSPAASDLRSVTDALVERSVWIVGGDGWAYDIGFGGLDHVLASGCNVNVLVLDTEVYSNTGGQASKATPRGAVAKFAAQGKPTGKKDLGMIAMAYGNVYVAQIALGSSPRQSIRALREAEAYPGPSLVIAYSTCIAHGIDMERSMSHQRDAVKCGFWPLYRFVPTTEGAGQPFQLDCRKPSAPFREFAMQEARFAMLARSRPKVADRLLSLAQQDIDERWRLYEQLAGVQREVPHEEVEA